MSQAIEYVLFDLDDTLYPPGRGLMRQINARINAYLGARVGLATADAEALRCQAHARFGSSLRPLAAQYHFDLDDFLTYAHAVDIEASLAPDPDLACLLDCIQTPRVIFTNAPHAYAERVLAQLGIAPQFARLFAYEFGECMGKPNAAVYVKAQRALNAPGEALVMVDDALSNLAPARALGWKTIWVNPNGQGNADSLVDFSVQNLWQIADAFQQLGIMDAQHRAAAEHRLMGCAWAERNRAHENAVTG